MAHSTLRPVLAATSVIVLSACAYAKPYEMSFSKPAGTTATDRSSAKICADAFSAPGDSDQVLKCLQARGYDWDVRGFTIRQQSGLAGHMSIPAAAMAVGLAAAGNTSDIVPIMGIAGGTYLAHAGAYARPDQAQVYELAADSYRCLVAGAAEWKADGKEDLIKAKENLKLAQDNFLSISSDTEKKELVKQKLAAANILYSRVDGASGLTLLRQSNAIETAARTAIGDRLPSAQAVAASVGFGAKIVAPAAVPQPSKPANSNVGGLVPFAMIEGIVDPKKKQREALEREAIDKFNRAEEQFYTLLKAHQAKERTISIECRFNPLTTPQLAAPAEIILDADGKAGFVLKGGVPPYGYLPLPDKVKVTVTPLTANAAHIAIDLNGSGGDGPWDVTIIDASQAGDTRTISVKKPAKPDKPDKPE